MRRLLASALLSGLVATGAQGAGPDRSGQWVGIIFEKGTRVELSFGLAQPKVSGTLGPYASGDMARDFRQLGLAFRTEINDRLALGLIVDQPIGADVGYPMANYPLTLTTAAINSTAVTGFARWKLSEAFSLHGGLRQVEAGGNVAIWEGGNPAYVASLAPDSDLGWMAGVAYEMPEIALRVALTYFSPTTHVLPTTVSAPFPYSDVTTVEVAEAVNLDFQTGIATDTLVFGQIRWVDWKATDISPAFYPKLVAYRHDYYTLSAGVGHRFSDSWAGAITVGYENDDGAIASNLAPHDGMLSLGLGATYTAGPAEVTLGARYFWLGDATTQTLGAEFADSSALGLGLRVAYNF